MWKAQEGIVRVMKDNKVGFINYKGKIALPVEYDEVGFFERAWKLNKGVARVARGGKVGYLDHNAEVIINIEYDDIDHIFPSVWREKKGFVLAQKNGNYTYLNHKGEEIIPPIYAYLSPIQNGKIIAIKQKLWGVIDTLHTVKVPFLYSRIRASGDDYFIAENNDVEEVEINKFAHISKSNSEKKPFSLSSHIVKTKADKKALYTSEGRRLTKFKYSKIDVFNEGLALVQLYHKNRKMRKFGFIDEQGLEVIPCTLDFAKPFSEGLAEFKKGKWGYISKTGQVIIKPRYHSTKAFSSSYAIVNDKLIIDKEGKHMGQIDKTLKTQDYYINSYLKSENQNGFFHLNPNGIRLYATDYEAVTDFIGGDGGGLAMVKKGEKWQLTRTYFGGTSKVNFTFKTKRDYLKKYGNKRKFNDSMGMQVRDGAWQKTRDGVWRLINEHGFFVRKMYFTDARIEAGKLKAKTKKKYTLIEAQSGQVIVKKQYYIMPVSREVIYVELAKSTKYYDTQTKSWLK